MIFTNLSCGSLVIGFRAMLFYAPDPVRSVIHRVIVDNEPFRTTTNGLELRNVDGVRIETAASWFLEELNAQDGG